MQTRRECFGWVTAWITRCSKEESLQRHRHVLQCCVLPFIAHDPSLEGLARGLGRHLGKALPSQRFGHKGTDCTCCTSAFCMLVFTGGEGMRGQCEACNRAVFFSPSRVRTKSSQEREKRRKRQRSQKRGGKRSIGTSLCQGFSPLAPAAHCVPNLL